jgi:hypothetical protein
LLPREAHGLKKKLKMVNGEHSLQKFVKDAASQIQSDYDAIRLHASADPGTAGDSAEASWVSVLKDWLPPSFRVETKGRIIGPNGELSDQVDIVVLKPSYPPKLAEKKIWLAAGIAAVFECKLTLKHEHVQRTFDSCVKLKRLFVPRLGTPYSELHAPAFFGLLAHSHNWKTSPSELLENKILEAEKSVSHPRELVDFICVADVGCWSTHIIVGITQRELQPLLILSLIEQPNFIHTLQNLPILGMQTVYVGPVKTTNGSSFNPDPVGALIFSLLDKLAWLHPELRDIAAYFQSVGVDGSRGGKLRFWPVSLLSESLQLDIHSGKLQDYDYVLNQKSWSEWSKLF